MTNNHIFAHPKQLSNFARSAQDTDAEPVDLTLQLLHALQDETLLAPSRNPGSKFMRDGEGRRLLNSPTEHEYFDLVAIGKAWRAALLAVPPELVERVAFDQTLPRALRVDGESLPLHWETSLKGAGVAVISMDVSCLVIGMATVLRTRRDGGVGVRCLILFTMSGRGLWTVMFGDWMRFWRSCRNEVCIVRAHQQVRDHGLRASHHPSPRRNDLRERDPESRASHPPHHKPSTPRMLDGQFPQPCPLAQSPIPEAS